MEKKQTALDAKFEAQKLAFAPLFFQAVVALRELGIMEYIFSKRKKVHIKDIVQDLGISEYGVRVLLEAAKISDVVTYHDRDHVSLTKVGFFMLKDEMTRVNINFVNDVCYDGAKHLTDCIRTGKPEGLKEFGNWKTVYEGLSQLPENVKKSWFEFDHYYSDDAFPAALEIVFSEKPQYLFDIGGNTGKWSLACCQYDADVKIKILDLPGQLQVAQKNITEKGFAGRVDFHKIDLLDVSQKIPKGANAVWMSQFLDCFSEEEILQILRNVHQASDENTNVYIMEPFFDNQKFDAAEYCLTGTSLYFTTIANGNSKMYSMERMLEIAQNAGFEIEEVFPLIGDSYHTILKCRKK